MTRQIRLADGSPARVPGRLRVRYETTIGGIVDCLGTVDADEAVAVDADGPEAAR